MGLFYFLWTKLSQGTPNPKNYYQITKNLLHFVVKCFILRGVIKKGSNYMAMNKTKKASRTVHCQVDQEVADALDYFAKNTGMTKTAIVEKSLMEYIQSWARVYQAKEATQEEIIDLKEVFGKKGRL